VGPFLAVASRSALLRRLLGGLFPRRQALRPGSQGLLRGEHAGCMPRNRQQQCNTLPNAVRMRTSCARAGLVSRAESSLQHAAQSSEPLAFPAQASTHHEGGSQALHDGASCS